MKIGFIGLGSWHRMGHLQKKGHELVVHNRRRTGRNPCSTRARPGRTRLPSREAGEHPLTMLSKPDASPRCAARQHASFYNTHLSMYGSVKWYEKILYGYTIGKDTGQNETHVCRLVHN